MTHDEITNEILYVIKDLSRWYTLVKPTITTYNLYDTLGKASVRIMTHTKRSDDREFYDFPGDQQLRTSHYFTKSARTHSFVIGVTEMLYLLFLMGEETAGA